MAAKRGIRKAENSPAELVHGFRELDIELRQAAGIMGRERHIDCLVDVGPFRVMVELLAARAMNPKASLKSLKTNFLVMASRPATSRQPVRRASADLRASPESFSAISALHSAASRRHQRTPLANSRSILT